MLNILSKSYFGISSRDIYDNIRYHWPFLTQRIDSLSSQNRPLALLKNVKHYFIAQLVKVYVENGYNIQSEIASMFQSQENPRGISKDTILRAIRQEFGVSSWAGFLSLHGADLSPYSLMHLDIREFINVGGKSLEDYIKFTLSTYIVKGTSEREILEELRADQTIHLNSLQSLQRYIYKFWGSLANARKMLVAPILSLYFKRGYTSAQIRERVPFFQKRGSRLKAGDAVRLFCKQWFTINPTQARNILTHRSLNEFLNQYLYNQ